MSLNSAFIITVPECLTLWEDALKSRTGQCVVLKQPHSDGYDCFLYCFRAEVREQGMDKKPHLTKAKRPENTLNEVNHPNPRK